MKRLIISADDLGVNPQRSHGIFQAHEFGVLTNASILPNMEDSDRAAKHAREKHLPSGLHLNLTEGYPLSKKEDVPSLLDLSGVFLDRAHFRVAVQKGKVVREHLEREIRAQIEWFFDSHGAPTHVDGHHHIHVEEMVANALIPQLDRYGIRFVRIPREDPLPPFGYDVPEEQLARTAELNARAMAAWDLYSANGIGTTEHFRGLTLVGNASLKNLRHNIVRLPDGTTELMTHPGSMTAYGTPFDLDPQRQTELNMLLDPTIPELLRDRKVELISYADL